MRRAARSPAAPGGVLTVTVPAAVTVMAAFLVIASTVSPVPSGMPAAAAMPLQDAPAPLPRSADLRPILEDWGLGPSVQGERGTCSVFVVTRALEFAMAKVEGRGTRLSVEYLNWASNRVLGEHKDGSFFSDLWKGFEAHGIPPEADMPYRPTYDPELAPSRQVRNRAAAARRLGLRLRWIKEWDPKKGLSDAQLEDVRRTLAAGWPVCGGFLWPKEQVWDDDVLRICPRDRVRDGHSVLLVGYRDDPDRPGGGLVIIRNTSRDGRDGYLTYEYLKAYMNDAAWIEAPASDGGGSEHGRIEAPAGGSRSSGVDASFAPGGDDARSRGVDLHLAPDGDDAWSGGLPRPNAARTDGPVATLTGARDAIRRLRAGHAPAGPVRVLVAGGRYPLAGPLVLAPEDGGTEKAPISYEAAPGARPVFTGGRVIRGFRPGPDGVWVTDVPDVAAGRWYFEQLFVNGRRAVRARTPNRFWFHLLDVKEEPIAAEAGSRRARQARQTVWLAPRDFDATLAGLSADALKDVNFVVYHNWDNTRRFIDAVDPAESSFATSGEGMKSWNPWRKKSHYILENFRAALDAPGEWFLGRDGTLHYMPLPGEDMATAEVVAPSAERFVEIRGEPAAGKYVEHVAFRGLTFHHAQWLTPPGGFEAAQAAAPIEAVFQADGARHVTLEDCEIGHVGTYVVWFRKGCTDNAVRRCHLFDFGAGGVRIGEMGLAREEKEATARNVVEDCIVRHGGSIFPCAVGVWIGFSPENRIVHNEIADLFYTGISIGWRWGYAESTCKRNTISFNRVHHLGWGLLSDMGGIYTLGPSEGTVVSNNVFHDIHAYSYGGWGLYTDEGSTGISFENNLVHDTKTGSFHQHYGKANVIRNNILVDSKLHQVQATRVEEHLSFTFEGNIICWSTGPALAGRWDQLRFASGGNCWWNAGGAPVEFVGNSLERWQEMGHEKGSIVADPLFVDAAKRDFRLRPDSPALALGFRTFDPAEAGVRGDAAWVAKARGVTYPPLELPPEPPPTPVRDTFERDAPGRPPAGIGVHVEGKGDSIVVTEETAASGKRSVKVTDAPGLQHAWNPHINWDVSYSGGRIRNGFALRVEKASVIGLEWRDWSEGDYRTGARFDIRGGRLHLPGGATLDLPEGEWVRFALAGPLGGGTPATWTLRVEVPGRDPREFAELPYASAGFRKLTWVGFTSNATAATSFYIDDFTLEP